MLRTRIIPVLLLKGGGLYKTVKFKDPKYVGDPINAIKIFNEKEVDELIFLDIEASKNALGPNYKAIESFVNECFMPICYGGGINSVDQMKRIFALGIEKVSLNVSALEDLNLVREGANHFGSQSIIVSIDIKKDIFGKYKVYNHKAKKTEKKDLIQYVLDIQKAGAGELFINSVDNDGTLGGYDFKMLEMILKYTKIPIVACGGARSIDDFVKAQTIGVSGCAAGSMFVFHGKHRAVLITYPELALLEKYLHE